MVNVAGAISVAVGWWCCRPRDERSMPWIRNENTAIRKWQLISKIPFVGALVFFWTRERRWWTDGQWWMRCIHKKDSGRKEATNRKMTTSILTLAGPVKRRVVCQQISFKSPLCRFTGYIILLARIDHWDLTCPTFVTDHKGRDLDNYNWRSYSLEFNTLSLL